MSAVPAFEIGLRNAWLVVLPYLLVNYGLSLLIVDRKASLFMRPSDTEREKTLLAILMVILAGSWVYGIFRH